MPITQPVTTPPSLLRALTIGALLVVVDAFVLNQGAIAGFVGLWVVLISLPCGLLSSKYSTVRTQHLRNLGIYVLAVMLVFALNAINNRLARARAEVLITAIEDFKVKNQRYPRSLEELVPTQIESIPPAKFTLSFNRFSYFTSDDHGTSLYYVDLPPYGRPTYSFEGKKWGYMD